MKKIFLLLITVFLMSFVVSSFVRVQASTTVTYDIDGIFDTGGTWDGLSGSGTRGNTLSLDVSSKPAGHDFAFWIINGVVRKDLAVDHEYVLTSVNVLQAVFTPTDKVAAVFIDSNGRYLGVKYTEGGAVVDTGLTIPAERPGFVVSSSSKWTSIEGSASISDVQENSVFVLTYEEAETPIGAVTTNIIGGILNGEYTIPKVVPFNSIITASANTPLEGSYFVGWEENGIIVSYNEVFKFSALSNRTLKAQYSNTPIAKTPIVTISHNLNLRTNYFTYQGQFELPDNYTLVEYGIIVADIVESNLTLDTVISEPNVKITAQGTNFQSITKEFVISIHNTSISNVLTHRAYIIVKNGDNDIEYYYSSDSSGSLMIYSAYGGGGNTGAYYKYDYVVLYNGTNEEINLNGYSIQYASTTGTSWSNKLNLTGTIKARGFYTIRLAAGSGGVDIPFYNQSGSISMAGTGFKLALMNTTTQIGTYASPHEDPALSAFVVDFIGIGSANRYEGSAAVSAISNTTAAQRKLFKDTNQNSSDFSVISASQGHLDYTNLPTELNPS